MNKYTLIDDLMDIDELEGTENKIPPNIMPPEERNRVQKFVREPYYDKYTEHYNNNNRFNPDFTPELMTKVHDTNNTLGNYINSNINSNSNRPGYQMNQELHNMGQLGVPGYSFEGYKGPPAPPSMPPPAGYTCSCLDVHNHIDSCPICSRFYKNNNYIIYISVIVILVIICLILLKKALD